MSWINEFTKSASSLFKGQILAGFQPLDFSHFLPLWYALWITNIAHTIKILDLESKHFDEINEILPPPSNMRAILVKLIPAYYANPTKNKKDYNIVANFFARMLKECCPNDPFALKSNTIHTSTEIISLVSNINWNNADIQSARKVGQLITATGSLVHGLYNDLVTDLGWEVYGPYISTIKQTLLIRLFPNLQPKELWPEKYLASMKEITIYATYEDVEWNISFVGCHTISNGKSPVEGMTKYAIYGDGKKLNLINTENLIDELSKKATDIYSNINSMSSENLKLLVMRQECYQLKLLFDEAGIDWQPTAEMIEVVKSKQILHGVFPRDKFIESTEEFKKIFGIDVFEKEILNILN
ncbi:MAG: hypothetical protein WCT33_01245 [Patescibacteria group bacterium]